jgi:hypothetical protein
MRDFAKNVLPNFADISNFNPTMHAVVIIPAKPDYKMMEQLIFSKKT